MGAPPIRVFLMKECPSCKTFSPPAYTLCTTCGAPLPADPGFSYLDSIPTALGGLVESDAGLLVRRVLLHLLGVFVAVVALAIVLNVRDCFTGK